MKRLFTALCACAVLCGATAADTKVATREWVAKRLAARGIRVSQSVVSSNADGTVTYTSPFSPTNSDVTNAATISLTFSAPVVRSAVARLRAAPRSWLSLILPVAFADTPLGGTTITMTLSSGGWTGNDGRAHLFVFDPPLDLENQDGETYPDVPSSTHACSRDSTCLCIDYRRTDAEKAAERDALYPVPATEDLPAYYGWRTWIDPAALKKIGPTHFIIDDAGNKFDIEDVQATDAWRDAVESILGKVREHMLECRVAYDAAHTCGEDNPKHLPVAKTCGAQSWRVCGRNASHVIEEPGHNGHTAAERCICGETASPHAITEGAKVAKTGNTGWTQTIGCSLGCGYGRTIDHTCVHKYCRPCSAGDGCDWACPTCDGSHNFVGGADACSRCVCPDCGIVKTLSIGGGAPVQTHSDHGGWKRCGKHEEEGNEYPGSYAHCVCECGFNSCQFMSSEWDAQHGIWNAGRSAVSLHTREDLDEPTYSRIEGNDGKTHHYRHTKSDCRYCGAPWAVKEKHQYPEEVAGYKWLSNEKCAAKKICEMPGCGYEHVEDLESAGSHSPDGEPFDFKDAGDGEHCRWWYHCIQCGKDYYEDVAHVKSTVKADHCLCAKCKQYQFPHMLAEDACGNQSCKICGWVDPEAEETHTGHTKDERCLCGRETKPHVWGDWQYVGRDGDYDIYRRVCALSCGIPPEELRISGNMRATCVGNNHMLSPTNDCTCLCGLFNPSAPSTDRNLHTFESGHCLCNCGNYHDKQDWPNPNGSDVCPAVCSVCKTRSASGLNVSAAVVEDEHTPVSTGRCGCKCGKLNHSASSARFHPKCPQTCRCYGSKGDGTGSWHYPCGMTGCPNVCSYAVNGKYHVANTGSAPVQASLLFPAEDIHHTPLAMGCGCRCGAVSANDIADKPNSPLHMDNPSSCGCYCGAKELPHRYASDSACRCLKGDYHRKVDGGRCPQVCATCGYYASSGPIASLSRASVLLHEPSGSECACKCSQSASNIFGRPGYSSLSDPDEYPALNTETGRKWHSFPGSQCRCKCEKVHWFNRGVSSDYEKLCPSVCKTRNDGGANGICGYNRDYTAKATHVGVDGYCGCECGYTDTHYAAPGGCYCWGEYSPDRMNMGLRDHPDGRLLVRHLQPETLLREWSEPPSPQEPPYTLFYEIECANGHVHTNELAVSGGGGSRECPRCGCDLSACNLGCDGVWGHCQSCKALSGGGCNCADAHGTYGNPRQMFLPDDVGDYQHDGGSADWEDDDGEKFRVEWIFGY